jgi:hypothetical protein
MVFMPIKSTADLPNKKPSWSQGGFFVLKAENQLILCE